MADAQPSNQKKPYKRKMTDKRRDQNRAAQKTYRARRKERLELLEKQVSTLQDHDQDNEEELNRTCTSDIPFSNISLNSLPELRGTEWTAAASTALTLSTDPIAGLRTILKANTSKDTDVLLAFAIREKPNISEILFAGLRALKNKSDELALRSGVARMDEVAVQQQSPEWAPSWLEAPHVVPILPNVLADGIFLRQQPFMDVLHHNSQKIGLRLEMLADHTLQSPWYSPLPSFPSSLVPLSTVPPDLLPTPAQRRYPHHPFIDLIPFPWLRERHITLSLLDPPPFNHMEFKQDLISNGLICWKSRAGREGLPWDRRSWEIQPWFWTKWGWLIEEQGKVEQQSRWWRALRAKRDP